VIDVLAFAAQALGSSGDTSFPNHVHMTGTVSGGGQWTHGFDLTVADLDVPIAATIEIEGACSLPFPGFGCLGEWTPDLDARLIDPNGGQLAESTCALGDECGLGRQETLHAMPTVAGTYEIQVYAFNNGETGAFDLDLSTGPVGETAPPPPPPPPPSTMHVGDLDRSSVNLSATRWRAKATIRVHSSAEALLPGVLVTGRWGQNGSVSCTTTATGACTVTRDLKRSRLTIVFTVLGLSDGGAHTYVAADNHDPDGDSNGTKITVTRP
jgi:serine protease AprX